jgi:U3 small nucleolar RNA-associated protein 14
VRKAEGMEMMRHVRILMAKMHTRSPRDSEGSRSTCTFDTDTTEQWCAAHAHLSGPHGPVPSRRGLMQSMREENVEEECTVVGGDREDFRPRWSRP